LVSTEYEVLGDARVGQALRHEVEHGAFTVGQGGERVVGVAGRDQAGNDVRVESGSPGGDPLCRREELVDL
jgi:hypothetical protein